MAIEKNFKVDSSKVSRRIKDSKIMNEQHTVFQLVRQLVQAHVNCNDEELTRKLWNDVAERGIDLDRVINLMYTCTLHEDEDEMIKIDDIYQSTGLVG